MNDLADVSVALPRLPTPGGSLPGAGSTWTSVGGMGGTALDIPLPVSPCRTGTPALALSYRTHAGNGLFGMGWSIGLPCIRRRTTHGVPCYDDSDVFVGPDDHWLVPVGQRLADHYGSVALSTTYNVDTFRARVAAAPTLIERWTPVTPPGPALWLIHEADGTLKLFGGHPDAVLRDPAQPDHIAEWRLRETVTPLGEHTVYDYVAEDGAGVPDDENARDKTAARYPGRVRYGNTTGDTLPYGLRGENDADARDFFFELVLDYGSRALDPTAMPTHGVTQAWGLRDDRHGDFAYGFEHRQLRLCRQVLMFHRLDGMTATPSLVRRMLLEYETSSHVSRLVGIRSMAYRGTAASRQEMPPMDFAWTNFDSTGGTYVALPAIPALDAALRGQWVDLYGEGLPGILHRDGAGWVYRQPQRQPGTIDGVSYGEPEPLPQLPAMSRTSASIQPILMDLTGDGRLDWIVADTGLSGFHTLGPDRQWSGFTPFRAFPEEFLHARAQWTDLTGAGLMDIALIGPTSVRVYPNLRDRGYGHATDVPHDDRDLPAWESDDVLVAFADLLGSGQQHLVSIDRGGAVTCWPNLGGGRFGSRLALGVLDLRGPLDAARLFLADLDGAGPVDVLYATSNGLLIFSNRSGLGFDDAVERPWPPGFHYDRTCTLTFADIAGTGCPGMLVSTPHGSGESLTPRHWRLDFTPAKPHLLAWSNNNRGCGTTLVYRSSAQEWLDEKAEAPAGTIPVCRLPFAMYVVKSVERVDEIGARRARTTHRWRGGYYDGVEKQLRGFAMHEELDDDATEDSAGDARHAPGRLSRTWHFVGDSEIDATLRGVDLSDGQAVSLRSPLITTWDNLAGRDVQATGLGKAELRELWAGLAGFARRIELFGTDNRAVAAYPFKVTEFRPHLRQLDAPDDTRNFGSCLCMAAEELEYLYERLPADPRRTHSLHLIRDAFGNAVQSVTIHGARRDIASPYPAGDEETWWTSSIDEQQAFHYVSETLRRTSHLDEASAWRLGLVRDVRRNSMVLARESLDTVDICIEKLEALDSPLVGLDRKLDALDHIAYENSDDTTPPPFHGLPTAILSAALDADAVDEYEQVLEPDILRDYLSRGGYTLLSSPLLAAHEVLWAKTTHITMYADLTDFHRVLSLATVGSIRASALTYDATGLFVASIEGPDRLVSTFAYDHVTLQPHRCVDPQRNVHEVALDPFGRVYATSFHGTELSESGAVIALGFASFASAWPAINVSTAQGIVQADETLAACASVHLYDDHSWMGQLALSIAEHADAWLAAGWITEDGHVRARAHRAQQEGAASASFGVLGRLPCHVVNLRADRYDRLDPARHIAMDAIFRDGSGHTLQTSRRVPPAEGMSGGLRWAVGTRDVWHDRGFPIRTYRPRFTDAWDDVHDPSVGGTVAYVSLYYDAIGRRVSDVNAKGGVRRTRFHAWYSVTEDEIQSATTTEP